eukprot:113287_1
MAPLASYIILLLLPCLCQSIPFSSLSAGRVSRGKVSFFPRGGAGAGHRNKTASTGSASDADPLLISEESVIDSDEEEHPTTPPFDLQEVSKQLHREEIAEVKKAQEFLQKQQRRRDLDKTWLDKGITAVIEFGENLFRWEVIEK